MLEYEEYFRDPQFLDSCIHAASQKQTFYSISFAGVSLYANQGSSDPMILAVLIITKGSSWISVVTSRIRGLQINWSNRAIITYSRSVKELQRLYNIIRRCNRNGYKWSYDVYHYR